MNRKKKWILSAAAGVLIAAAVLCICYTRQQKGQAFVACGENWSAETAGNSTSISQQDLKINVLLTKPPLLRLKDVLSSTDDNFEIASGNYSWYYRTVNEDEMIGSVACGSAPLDEAKEKERLKLVQYNNLDFVSYIISLAEKPDYIVVTEYAVTDLGNTDAEALSSEAYDEVLVVHLKPERVYEITAEWAEEKLNERGFYGNASYVVVTE